MTDSSEKSSPASLVQAVFAKSSGSPPRSPEADRARHSRSPRTPSPLPPFPPEVFLSILRFLPPRDQKRACLVARSWRSFVIAEPQFWSRAVVTLERDELDSFQQSLFFAVGNGNKKREGLKDLVIRHHGAQGRRLVPCEDAIERLEQTIAFASQACTLIDPDGRHLIPDPETGRYSTLRSLHLALMFNHTDTVYLLHEFAKIHRAPLFFNLDSFRLDAAMPFFLLDGAILLLFPSIKSLTLVFHARRGVLKQLQTTGWYWRLPEVPSRPSFMRLDCLVRLHIEGAQLGPSLFIPDALPSLRDFVLNGVTWHGFGIFRLLRIARRTLERIELVNLRFEPTEDEWEDWSHNVDVRDPELTDGHRFDTAPQDVNDFEQIDVADPCPIILPNLRTLALIGSTPPIFTSLQFIESGSDTGDYPTPVFVMPKLTVARFDDTIYDPEVIEDVSTCAFTSFGRNAPEVERLELTCCTVDDRSVFSGLAAMSARITFLDFFETTISDQLLASLPNLTPRLQVLDVRRCVDVSCQGVARVVEVIRQLGDEGQYRLEQVFVDAPEFNDHEWRAYNWLDFVGVLGHGEEEFEGLGPQDVNEKRDWIRAGKRDAQWEFKEALRQREEEEARRRQWVELQQLQATEHLAAGGSLAGGSSFAAFGFAPPRPHTLREPNSWGPAQRQQQQQQHQQQLTPRSQSTLLLPNLPPPSASTLVQESQPMNRGTKSSSQYSSYDATAGSTSSMHTRIRSQESQLDLKSLDAVESFDQLDPALIREQQLALAQIEQSRTQSHEQSASGQPGGGFVLSQDEAIAAAQRAADQVMSSRQQQTQDPRLAVTNDRRVISIASTPNLADPRTAGLADLRRTGQTIDEEDDTEDEVLAGETYEQQGPGIEEEMLDEEDNNITNEP
ncbi:uncharacterized protein JCM15063_002584 [Sporobolomyces koalae]|uniref:uncharacterized protein n=1 Tax=Sporobolomyces koalae TaxID=500713 RepID=UPI00317B5743